MGPFHHLDNEIERFRRRVIFCAIAVLILFGVLLGRLFWLQVIQHDYYQTRAESNRISLVPITPNRGIIRDRNGIVLAHNYSAFTLEITPSQVDDLEQTLLDLSTVVDIQPKDRKRFKRLLEEARNFESIPIRTRLSDEEVARFAAQRYRFPGVEIKARLFREYPLAHVAAHALGYIGRISERDRDWIEEQGKAGNYRGTEHIGKSGIEQFYEFELHGRAGHEEVEIDAGGRALRSLKRTPPVSGNDLTLTLDARLQEIAEKAFGNRRGALVAIEPSTGGVLALVSMPHYDPNLFVDGISSENWKELNEHLDKPMVNRAIYGSYPPGSTFKPFMALAALELGFRKPHQTIFCPGYFIFGNNRFRDSRKGGNGVVDMYKSIVVSSDTYYYQLANDMGIDRIAHFMSTLGLGQRSGIDLGKDGVSESEGVLPSPAWKKKRFKKPEQQKWYAGETISIGIGQGYNNYTMIQLAQATATLANNGVMYRPHLVRHITDTRSGEQRHIEPEPIRQLKWKQEHIDFVKRAMQGVMTSGTGARAFAGAPYTAAGKTGTSQVFSLKGATYRASAIKERLRDHALFVAFAPVENPKIALALIVENGGFGAQSAAPIARMVMDHYLTGQSAKGPAHEDAEAREADADHDEEDSDVKQTVNGESAR